MIKYSIIEEQGKVIARIDGCKEDVLKVIEKQFGKSLLIVNPDDFSLRDSYRGVAMCHPEDEFSVEEGKRVAREKMLKKYNRDFNRHIMFFSDSLRELSEKADEMESRYIR